METTRKLGIKDQLIATASLAALSAETDIAEKAEKLSIQVAERLAKGSKILLAGNGGSAADAQHIAAEFVNYFNFKRAGLPAVALTVDSSVMTSISNDTSFDLVFSRQIEALGKEGDIAWLYTTSGNSKNIIEAAKAAKKKNMLTVVFCGSNFQNFVSTIDYVLAVPSTSTPKIQEIHLILGHAVSGLVESLLFSSEGE